MLTPRTGGSGRARCMRRCYSILLQSCIPHFQPSSFFRGVKQFGSGYLESSGVSDLGRREHDLVKISVSICTHNRQESLLRTLKSLREQEKVSADLEILVIDNNCTDGTAQVVQEFREVVPVRRILEPKQGLSHARNRAAAEFCGDVLLFTDDDIRLDPASLPLRACFSKMDRC